MLQPQVDCPGRPRETPTGVAGQAAQELEAGEAVTGTGATENRPGGQFVHVSSEVLVQPAELRLVPAAQVVHGVQPVALAADQLTPLTQLVQTAFVVAVQVEDR